MPRKIQRTDSHSLSKTSASKKELAVTDLGVGMLAASYAYGQTVQAAATVYAATANLVATTVQSLAECGKAYFNYIEECQRTRQVEIWSATVIAVAREQTQQMEIQAEALIFDAREQTRRIEIHAEITREQIRDTQAARDARMEIVRTFLDEHHRLHELFINQRESGLQNLSVDERVHLSKYRDDVLQRLRELESAIASLAHTL